MLAVEPNIPAQRICQVIGFDKALVSRTVQALAARGYVSVAPDEGDSRRRAITLTPEGQALHDRVIRVALERERRLLAGLAPDEVETLIALLRRLNAQVGAVNAYVPDEAEGRERASRRGRGKRGLARAAE